MIELTVIALLVIISLSISINLGSILSELKRNRVPNQELIDLNTEMIDQTKLMIDQNKLMIDQKALIVAYNEKVLNQQEQTKRNGNIN
jgi:hypothetical protein